MTNDVTKDSRSSSPSAQNRYVMLAVLAVVALITVYLLKKNMEPPRQPEPGAQQPAPAQQETTSEEAMQQIMTQIAHIKDVLAEDSTNYGAWVALGNAFYDANMPEESVEHYEQALALQPGDVGVMTDLSTMKRALGQPEKAVDILRQVVAIDSTFEQAWFNLGVIHAFDLDDKRAAVDAWKRFLAVAKPSPHIDAIRKEVKRMEAEL